MHLVGEPQEPAEPWQSAEPAEQAKPAEPAEPAEPTELAEPAESVEQAEPAARSSFTEMQRPAVRLHQPNRFVQCACDGSCFNSIDKHRVWRPHEPANLCCFVFRRVAPAVNFHCCLLYRLRLNQPNCRG